MTDPTLRFYADNAEIYARRQRREVNERLDALLDRLPPGARVLELGSGGGQDARHMIDRGFAVEATDGSPELAQQAKALLGQEVRVMRFDELSELARYDAVYASASLLHAAREDLPGIIARIFASLKASGLFWASYKAGAAEGHDSFGRFYNYLDATTLLDLYGPDWAAIDVEHWQGSGYDNAPTEWIGVLAEKG